MDNGASSYRRFLEGDDQGLYEIICAYERGLLLYLNSMVRNLRVAEELAEDTSATLAVRKPRFHGRSTFKTWLFAIGRNLAVSYLRREARRQHVPIEEQTDLQDETDLEREYIRTEQKIAVHRALRRLSPEYQQVLYLSYFEEFDNAQTAKIMHKTRRQIENLLYNARKRLRSELERDGFTYENL